MNRLSFHRYISFVLVINSSLLATATVTPTPSLTSLVEPVLVVDVYAPADAVRGAPVVFGPLAGSANQSYSLNISNLAVTENGRNFTVLVGPSATALSTYVSPELLVDPMYTLTGNVLAVGISILIIQTNGTRVSAYSPIEFAFWPVAENTGDAPAAGKGRLGRAANDQWVPSPWTPTYAVASLPRNETIVSLRKYLVALDPAAFAASALPAAPVAFGEAYPPVAPVWADGIAATCPAASVGSLSSATAYGRAVLISTVLCSLNGTVVNGQHTAASSALAPWGGNWTDVVGSLQLAVVLSLDSVVVVRRPPDRSDGAAVAGGAFVLIALCICTVGGLAAGYARNMGYGPKGSQEPYDAVPEAAQEEEEPAAVPMEEQEIDLEAAAGASSSHEYTTHYSSVRPASELGGGEAYNR